MQNHTDEQLVIENQAARIRWLTTRLSQVDYFAFIDYIYLNPFPSNFNPDQLQLWDD
jgi:hypothetical protein